jgi:hypothetical protein
MQSVEKASQSSRRARRETIPIVFSGGVYVGKNSSQPANVELSRGQFDEVNA